MPSHFPTVSRPLRHSNGNMPRYRMCCCSMSVCQSMDGYEVAHILRAHPGLQETPILMLTGRDGVRDHVRSKLAGARDFIAKPFRSGDLLRRVQVHLPYVPPTGATS